MIRFRVFALTVSDDDSAASFWIFPNLKKQLEIFVTLKKTFRSIIHINKLAKKRQAKQASPALLVDAVQEYGFLLAPCISLLIQTLFSLRMGVPKWGNKLD